MSQNPYQAPSTRPSSHPRRPFLAAHLLCAVVGSVVLVLIGLAVAALAMLPSDAPGFFLLSGVHLIACGMFGVICSWGKRRDPIRYLFCGTSMLVNAALAVRIALLVFDGTVRGPFIIAAPLLLGTPAVLNVVVAALNLRRESPTNT